jgi:hypothetical protein
MNMLYSNNWKLYFCATLMPITEENDTTLFNFGSCFAIKIMILKNRMSKWSEILPHAIGIDLHQMEHKSWENISSLLMSPLYLCNATVNYRTTWACELSYEIRRKLYIANMYSIRT